MTGTAVIVSWRGESITSRFSVGLATESLGARLTPSIDVRYWFGGGARWRGAGMATAGPTAANRRDRASSLVSTTLL
jgi:hypothetical protein